MTKTIWIGSADDALTHVHRVTCPCGWTTEHHATYYDLSEISPADLRMVDHIREEHYENRYEMVAASKERRYYSEESVLLAGPGELECDCRVEWEGKQISHQCPRRPTANGKCDGCQPDRMALGHQLVFHSSTRFEIEDESPQG